MIAGWPPPPDGGTPPAFLRIDRPELQGTTLVIRAVPAELRERRRLDRRAPLAYLYERIDGSQPQNDLALAAGHYDEANLVWSFSGEVSGIAGLTEPLSSAGRPPDR